MVGKGGQITAVSGMNRTGSMSVAGGREKKRFELAGRNFPFAERRRRPEETALAWNGNVNLPPFPLPPAEHPLAAVGRPQPEVGHERLCRRMLEAVAQLNRQADGIQMRFSGGGLEGIACSLVVNEGKVFCRLRAEGAVTRRWLSGAAAVLSRRLAQAGLELGAFEVKR